jgi:hypothetical protein
MSLAWYLCREYNYILPCNFQEEQKPPANPEVFNLCDAPGTGPFFGVKTDFASRLSPKTWTCPLPCSQIGPVPFFPSGRSFAALRMTSKLQSLLFIEGGVEGHSAGFEVDISHKFTGLFCAMIPVHAAVFPFHRKRTAVAGLV